MKNKKEIAEELSQELRRVINEIESSNDKFPVETGLLKVLVGLEDEMKNIIPDKKKLERGTFGIFRLVTESYYFQNSFLGREILSLYKSIKQFVKDFY